MEKQLLTEYRCACGKLLFKGLILVSVVEIKCKRCGVVKVFDTIHGRPLLFTFILDTKGVIVDACRTARTLYAADIFSSGTHITSLFPTVRDAPWNSEKEELYIIPRHVLTLKDCPSFPVETSIMPHYGEDNALDGYRAYSVKR
ncbi:MAG: hypothetical protein UY16_C0069G0006 [Candidatus Gottesmanbacteria bacterium GW2011_GWA2_47_9]|uniref:Uncharacterized protein n=1 Tax=Candidatus Gottesmanbacteria bacterium GW2011_GWA2_47_9 TaxID=1618445 RepID=A0A0G1TV95_9BACT|nr:MAG: hypothetical protein UY16_C0069G0006 [Candidatus Gottesmanbacteria bacterium GW2011_GWA2_47_9]